MMKYNICPHCGGPVIALGFHRCRGIGAIPSVQPAAQEPRDPHDFAQPEHLGNMSRYMEEHEQTCESCSYFKQYELRTRCVEFRKLQDIQAFWAKRVEVQK